jgi:serine/threonine protein kinase
MDVLSTLSISESVKPSLFDQAKYIGFLGQGSFGTVKGYELPDGSHVAVKNIILQNNIDSETLAELNSLKILKDKPDINQLLAVRVNGSVSIDIMLTQHSGSLGQFIDIINQKDRVRVFNNVISQLLQGLYYIHSSYITHRDIKPNNILLDFNFDPQTNELLMDPVCYYADFGLSSQLPCIEKSYEPRSSNVGTTGYKAPELLEEKEYYLFQPDIWALGMTLMNYLTNDVHVRADDQIQELENIYALSNNTKTGIDVISILNKHDVILDDHYTKMLESMLLFDLDTRVKITEITHPVAHPQINYLPQRGNICNKGVTLDDYFRTVEWGNVIAKYYHLTITSCVISIDLFERYLANYMIKADKLVPIYVACLSIASKVGDNQELDLAEVVKYTDNLPDELQEAEIVVMERMNYMYMSCEIKVMIEKLHTFTKPYTALEEMYTRLKDNRNYPGDKDYDYLVSYVY